MKTYLGLELGSTRIIAVIFDHLAKVLAAGSYKWEKQLADRLFTYPEKQIIERPQNVYRRLAADERSGESAWGAEPQNGAFVETSTPQFC